MLLGAYDMLRAMDRIGEGARVPASMRDKIRILRNLGEHWDEPASL